MLLQTNHCKLGGCWVVGIWSTSTRPLIDIDIRSTSVEPFWDAITFRVLIGVWCIPVKPIYIQIGSFDKITTFFYRWNTQKELGHNSIWMQCSLLQLQLILLEILHLQLTVFNSYPNIHRKWNWTEVPNLQPNDTSGNNCNCWCNSKIFNSA